MVEVLGYVASAVIILSLTMTSIVRLRLIGLVGAVLFASYGALVSAWPIVATNVVIIGLQSYFLFRAFTDEEFFQLLEIRPESRYLAKFIEFYRDDIDGFQPGFVHDPATESLVFLVLRNTVPAGVFIGSDAGQGRMGVRLDYVTPRYRDMKAASFLFDTSRAAFTERGFSTLIAPDCSVAHSKYLVKAGFHSIGPDTYELDLAS